MMPLRSSFPLVIKSLIKENMKHYLHIPTSFSYLFRPHSNIKVNAEFLKMPAATADLFGFGIA
jgi:hypothetical protein